MKTIVVNDIHIGNDLPFVLIAGLNVLEDEKTIETVISKCIESSKAKTYHIFLRLLMTKQIGHQLILIEALEWKED